MEEEEEEVEKKLCVTHWMLTRAHRSDDKGCNLQLLLYANINFMILEHLNRPIEIAQVHVSTVHWERGGNKAIACLTYNAHCALRAQAHTCDQILFWSSLSFISNEIKEKKSKFTFIRSFVRLAFEVFGVCCRFIQKKELDFFSSFLCEGEIEIQKLIRNSFCQNFYSKYKKKCFGAEHRCDNWKQQPPENASIGFGYM